MEISPFVSQRSKEEMAMPCQRTQEMKKAVEKGKRNHMDRAQSVTVGQFVSELMRNYVTESMTVDNVVQRCNEDRTKDAAVHGWYTDRIEDVIVYGYHVGWLEEQDITGKNSQLDRKTAARILHQFLRIEMKEAEEENTDAALKLQDLYDCRRCVGHVMQIYVKGIMDGCTDQTGRCIFGMEQVISVEETQEIIQRLLHAKRRELRIQEAEKMQSGERITAAEALQYLKSDKHAKLIDVRPEYEFQENHLDGSQSIPLSAILKNPYVVSNRRDQMILLYCEQGYKSEIAANCLIDAGYETVLYFAWERENS